MDSSRDSVISQHQSNTSILHYSHRIRHRLDHLGRIQHYYRHPFRNTSCSRSIRIISERYAQSETRKRTTPVVMRSLSTYSKHIAVLLVDAKNHRIMSKDSLKKVETVYLPWHRQTRSRMDFHPEFKDADAGTGEDYCSVSHIYPVGSWPG